MIFPNRTAAYIVPCVHGLFTSGKKLKPTTAFLGVFKRKNWIVLQHHHLKKPHSELYRKCTSFSP